MPGVVDSGVLQCMFKFRLFVRYFECIKNEWRIAALLQATCLARPLHVERLHLPVPRFTFAHSTFLHVTFSVEFCSLTLNDCHVE